MATSSSDRVIGLNQVPKRAGLALQPVDQLGRAPRAAGTAARTVCRRSIAAASARSSSEALASAR